MRLLRFIGRRLAQLGFAFLSGFAYTKCPACAGEGFDPRAKSSGFMRDLATRKRCPLCLGTNAVPLYELARVRDRMHPRQDDIEDLLSGRGTRR